jgi:hypothetical protein
MVGCVDRRRICSTGAYHDSSRSRLWTWSTPRSTFSVLSCGDISTKTATRVQLVKPVNLLPCDYGLKSLQPLMRS